MHQLFILHWLLFIVIATVTYFLRKILTRSICHIIIIMHTSDDISILFTALIKARNHTQNPQAVWVTYTCVYKRATREIIFQQLANCIEKQLLDRLIYFIKKKELWIKLSQHAVSLVCIIIWLVHLMTASICAVATQL